MGTQYFCDNQRRRNIIKNDAAISINGIDYLEVLDSESPEEPLRQRTLLVRLLRPVPATLTRNNVRIEGGVRITPVHVEWAGIAANAASLFAAGLITAAERDFFAGLLEPDHLLLVRTDASGDYDTYCLKLTASLTDLTPPDGFDPILSEINFSFKVECPSDFDCEPEDDCPPEPESAPVIDYLAKDYNSFRQLILDRLAITVPDWQERHVPDLNIALVELLAYAGDYLSYFQDSAANEAYLGTARRRPSLRRHARLLNYAMHDGCNARTWLCFEANAEGDGQILSRFDPVTGTPTRLLTKIPEALILAEDELSELVSKYEPTIFELMHDVTLRQAHNRIDFYTWADENCCLPAGATRATLVDSDIPAEQLQLQPGDVLIFEELLDPATGQAADADLSHRHAVRLTAVSGGRDPLFDLPIVNIEWDGEDALPFPLCISAEVEGQLVENISVARGNVALADHGRTISGETLLPRRVPYGVSSLIAWPTTEVERKAQAKAHRPYRPSLQETGITQVSPLAATTPASLSLPQDPRQTLPVVTLEGDGNTWTPQRDLLNSDRFATEFVVETENDGRAHLRFGDDRFFGQMPAPNSQLVATYRVGNGAVGNIGAETIGHVVANFSGITGVRNPLPALGGVNAESLEEVRQYAPQAFRRRERAVTEADYAEMTERHPEVQKAVATRRWTGSWHTMFITVDRKGGLPVDADFETELRLHLERYRLAGQDVEIDAPHFVSLDVAMTVCVKPGYFRSDVKQALLIRFSNRRLPDGRRGFFHPDNFTFGQPVYLSEVIATVMDVTGVQWVDITGDAHRFQRWGELPRGEVEAGLIKMERLEIARLDNDPSLPENGKLEFFMEGGQ